MENVSMESLKAKVEKIKIQSSILLVQQSLALWEVFAEMEDVSTKLNPPAQKEILAQSLVAGKEQPVNSGNVNQPSMMVLLAQLFAACKGLLV